MTRDSIPRDDLYGELEVSRQASVAAIEAAYRRLVKQHHPDVARSDDVERIKRLNLAREWLTDLDRRRRYDVSRGFSPTSVASHDDRRATGPAARDTSTEATRTFGVNANEVRIFLASLRGLDSERARRVFDGRAVAHAKGYTAARRVAAEIGQAQRKTEWQLAREAASVIARGKLGDTTLTEQVVDVLADTAGAIAIRDLLSKTDYRTLMVPWTWKSARVDSTVGPTTKVKPAGSVTPARKVTPPAKKPIAAEAMPVATAAATASAAATTASHAATRPVGPPARGVAGAGAAAAVTPKVSIADLGSSPWQSAGTAPAAPTGKSAFARTIPLPLSARPNVGAPVAMPRPAVSLPRSAVPAAARPSVRRPRWLPAAVALVAVVAVAAALLGFGRPTTDQGIAALTDAPSLLAGDATAPIVAPGATGVGGGSLEPPSSDPGASPDPGATAPPVIGPGPGTTEPPQPTPPGATPRPTKPPATPVPPTPEPTPTPPPPTPTPEPLCVVPLLIGATAGDAPAIWAAAGFTGLVTSDPEMQPNQRIGAQSLAPGSSEPCSSGITIQKVA